MPFVTAVTTPVAAFTVATPGVLLTQAYVPATMLLLASRAVAVSVKTSPIDVIVVVCGATVVLATPPPTMLNADDVMLVNPAELATTVYPVPTLLSVNALNVATPPTALTLTVPPSVEPPGFEPIASVTVPTKPGMGLLLASRAVTMKPGVTFTFGDCDAPGCVVTTK